MELKGKEEKRGRKQEETAFLSLPKSIAALITVALTVCLIYT